MLADVSRVPSGYRARGRIVGENGVVRGERTLVSAGDNCAELVAALGLAVSLALDDLEEVPPAPVAKTETEPAPAPEPVTPVAVTPPRPDAPPPPPPPPPPPSKTSAWPRPSLRVSVGHALSFGTAPAAAFGIGVAAELRLGQLSFRLDGRTELSASDSFATPIAGAPDGRVATSLSVASASACFRAGLFSACGGGGGGQLRSETSGFSGASVDRGAVGFVLARALVDLNVTERVFFQPLVEVTAPLSRDRVEVAGTVVHTLPPAAMTLGVQFGARLF